MAEAWSTLEKKKLTFFFSLKNLKAKPLKIELIPSLAPE
jgi:hypothetical protein